MGIFFRKQPEPATSDSSTIARTIWEAACLLGLRKGDPPPYLTYGEGMLLQAQISLELAKRLVALASEG